MGETLVSVMLLGPFAAKRHDGSEVDLPRKARALLAFLVVNGGRTVSRDELAALLWGNSGTEQARQSLRQCLFVLRRAFHPHMADCLAPRQDVLTLAREGALGSDVIALEHLERSEACEDLLTADGLFRGDFLAGLQLPGETFDDWLSMERQRFSSARLRVLTRLAGVQAGAGDIDRAVETARRLIALDPFGEQSSRLLMELLAAGGQRGLAMVEHARIERTLREHLQLSPAAATRALADRIRRDRPIHSDVAPQSVTMGDDRAPVLPYAHASSDRASVAILPFANLTGEPNLDHVGRSLTEDVAATLVRERWPVHVTTPASSPFGQLSSAPDAVGPGARYVCGGSVRRSGGRVQVLLRLIDAASGRHLWADRIEASTDASLALQEELSARIVARMAPAIRKAEGGRVSRKPVEAQSAHELQLHAAAICRIGPKENAYALRLLRRAITLGPRNAAAHGLAARCHHLRRLMGWTNPDDQSLYEGVRLAHRAAELGEGDSEALWMAGLALAIIDGNMDDGQQLIRNSLAVSRSNASAWIASCFVHAHCGDTETALEHFQRAQAVNPDDASQHLQWHAAATAYFVAGRYEEAKMATGKALEQTPYYPGSLRMQIALASRSGRIEEAHDAARRLFKVNPDASIATMQSYWQPMVPHTPDAVALLIDGWKQAGMPSG